MNKTLAKVNSQFKEFRGIIDKREKELEGVSMELALGISEYLNILQKLSLGDPTARVKGKSKYSNLGRAMVGIIDVLGVLWVLKRTPKDITFFEETK